MKWEYAVASKPQDPYLETQLNNYGDEGWELAAVITNDSFNQFLFKRPKPVLMGQKVVEEPQSYTFSYDQSLIDNEIANLILKTVRIQSSIPGVFMFAEEMALRYIIGRLYEWAQRRRLTIS